jgi:putative ABC transport system permease protein
MVSEAQIGDPERVLRLQRDMLDRLATIPGVTDVSFTGNVPMAGERSRSTIYPEDAPIGDASAPAPLRWFRFVAPGFFHTIGTRLLAGRDFAALASYAPARRAALIDPVQTLRGE